MSKKSRAKDSNTGPNQVEDPKIDEDDEFVGGKVYDLDDPNAGGLPMGAPHQSDETAPEPPDEGLPGQAPSRKDVLARLLEKNEIILKLNKDNKEKDALSKDLNEKWLRSVAEFENYRKRSRKEWELLQQQTKAEVILDMLNVVDDFERAFMVVEDETGDFVQGIKLIYNSLRRVLERLGVTETDSLHQPFDPNFHMAIGQIESDSVEAGLVAEVVQKGYLLNDIIVRPARVIVAK